MHTEASMVPSLTCSSPYGMSAALTDIHHVCCCAPSLFRLWPAVSLGYWRADPFLTYEEVRERGRSLLAETAPRVSPFLSRRSMLRGNDAGQPSARESRTETFPIPLFRLSDMLHGGTPQLAHLLRRFALLAYHACQSDLVRKLQVVLVMLLELSFAVWKDGMR